MTHELILTSVERGLDPNTHGFCPVAADSAISPAVVQILCMLSRYRHLTTEAAFPRQNPTAYSHTILPDKLAHVLSRVADAGTDYQQQPNVLAHHIVLEGMEFAPEGPAWLLALPGFHLSEWNEPAVRFVQGRPIPMLTNPPSLTRRQQIARQYRWLDPQKMALTGSVDTESDTYRTAVQMNDDQIALAVPPSTPCPAWQELTDDSGWGGVLAETAITQQPVVLIFHPGQNILPLFVEALALLPQHFSWRVTFCTYVSELPEMLPFQWKGVVAGSDEAKQLAKDADHLVLDLTVPMGAAISGKYVDFARYGQEHLLPPASEEYTAAYEETKPYEDETKPGTEPSNIVPDSLQNESHSLFTPRIQIQKRPSGLSELLVRRASRFQFYCLYSIMFALVLFLLVLAMDQAGDFGIVQTLHRHWYPSDSVDFSVNTIPEKRHPIEASHSVLDTEPDESVMEQDRPAAEPEDVRKVFEENREQQRVPLLRFLESFSAPQFLAVNLPDVQDDQVDVPEKKTFDELSPLYPLGTALDLRFIPLFELPKMKVNTHQVMDVLPDFVWRVEAVDSDTHLETFMFLFQLTESGLVMEWQPEGLNNQHLYETVLSSLGFLQLSVADIPDTETLIPLFAPVKTEPIRVSDLAGLAESDTPELVVELPFASELWQRIFAEMRPLKTMRLEVWAEPAEGWMQIKSSPASEFHAEVNTSQQAGRTTESGETRFEHIAVSFVAETSPERVVWKSGKYAEQLFSEQESVKTERAEWEKKIGQLKTKIFEGKGNETDRSEREKYEAEVKQCNFRLNYLANLLEKLPEAYKEIGQAESRQFHYSVFLESAGNKRTLLILSTDL